MSARLVIRVLGPLAVELDGRPLALPSGRRARALLGWLALHPGVHSRSELAGRFWPDVLEASARTSLRGELVAVRRSLSSGGEEWLAATRDEVGLRPDVWVDATRFEQLAAAGREREALELCRGPLLAGLDEDWVYESRDRHQRRRAELLRALAAEREGAGALDEAVELTRRRIELEPLAEEAHRDLMRYLAAAGDRPAALVAFERLREQLAAELRIAPSQATRRLADELRAGPRVVPEGTRPPAPALPGTLSGGLRTAFVGRAPELARLRAQWHVACTEARTFVLIGGEPGIGKTRLVSEFCREAHAAGAAVLRGRCYEDPLLSYQPFAEAIREYARHETGAAVVADAGPGVGELARLVPELAELAPGLPEPLQGNPEGERYRMFEAVTTALSAAAARQPTVLVLEDLHWADRPTALMLSHVIRSLSGAALLVLGTYREADAGPGAPIVRALEEIRRDGAYERVRLTGLATEQAAALVRAAAAAAAPPPFVDAIHARTGGNPFFVEEIVRHLLETGAADPAAGRWTVGTPTAVPEGVRHVIERRVARLGEQAQGVLALAAVAGPDFSLDLVEQLVDVPGDELLDVLEHALRAGVLDEDPHAPGRYRFSHGLIRDTLYASLSVTRRARIHDRVGEALEGLHAGDRRSIAGELARHFLAAGTPDAAAKALEYSVQAGEEAMQRLAYEGAVAHFDRAVSLARDDDARRCELLLELGAAHAKAGDLTPARASFAAAAALARELTLPEALARAALGFSQDWVGAGGANADVIALLESAIGAVGDNDRLRARLLGRLAMELHFADEQERRERLSAEAVALARRSGDPATLAFALNAGHWSQLTTAHPRERLRLARELVSAAERSRELELCLQGHTWATLDLLELAAVDSVDAEISACVDLAERLCQPFYGSWTAGLPAMRALMLGEYAEGEVLAHAAMDLCRSVANQNGVLASQLQLAMIAQDTGRLDELPAIAESLDALTAAGWHNERPMARWRALATSLLVASGRREAARERLDVALAAPTLRRVTGELGDRVVAMYLADACAALGDVERAQILYDALAPSDGLCMVSGRGVYFWGAASRFLGVLAATLGHHDDARRHLEAALQTNERVGSPPWIARTQHDLARLLLEHGTGETARAAQLAEASRATAERLGMRPLAEAAQALRAEAEINA